MPHTYPASDKRCHKTLPSLAWFSSQKELDIFIHLLLILAPTIPFSRHLHFPWVEQIFSWKSIKIGPLNIVPEIVWLSAARPADNEQPDKGRYSLTG